MRCLGVSRWIRKGTAYAVAFILVTFLIMVAELILLGAYFRFETEVLTGYGGVIQKTILSPVSGVCFPIKIREGASTYSGVFVALTNPNGFVTDVYFLLKTVSGGYTLVENPIETGKYILVKGNAPRIYNRELGTYVLRIPPKQHVQLKLIASGTNVEEVLACGYWGCVKLPSTGEQVMVQESSETPAIFETKYSPSSAKVTQESIIKYVVYSISKAKVECALRSDRTYAKNFTACCNPIPDWTLWYAKNLYDETRRGEYSWGVVVNYGAYFLGLNATAIALYYSNDPGWSFCTPTAIEVYGGWYRPPGICKSGVSLIPPEWLNMYYPVCNDRVVEMNITIAPEPGKTFKEVFPGSKHVYVYVLTRGYLRTAYFPTIPPLPVTLQDIMNVTIYVKTKADGDWEWWGNFLAENNTYITNQKDLEKDPENLDVKPGVWILPSDKVYGVKVSVRYVSFAPIRDNEPIPCSGNNCPLCSSCYSLANALGCDVCCFKGTWNDWARRNLLYHIGLYVEVFPDTWVQKI